MKRSELEKHIGKSVEVKLFDGDTMQGILRKTGTEEVKKRPQPLLKSWVLLFISQGYLCM